MILKDYFEILDRDDVMIALLELYPEQEKNLDGYISAFDEIAGLTPNRTDAMRIRVYHVFQEYRPKYDLDTDDYISVCGVNPEAAPDDWGRSGVEITWAIEYSPWDEWVAMEVETVGDDDRFDSDEKVLAHILWEMTWSGFTQRQVKERADEIFERAKEVEDAIADGTIDQITTPVGDIFKDLGVEDPFDASS